MTLDIYNT